MKSRRTKEVNKVERYIEGKKVQIFDNIFDFVKYFDFSMYRVIDSCGENARNVPFIYEIQPVLDHRFNIMRDELIELIELSNISYVKIVFEGSHNKSYLRASAVYEKVYLTMTVKTDAYNTKGVYAPYGKIYRTRADAEAEIGFDYEKCSGELFDTLLEEAVKADGIDKIMAIPEIRRAIEKHYKFGILKEWAGIQMLKKGI
jgi:hypothetical protein